MGSACLRRGRPVDRAERLIARPSTNVAGASGGPATECVWANRPLARHLPVLEFGGAR